MDRVKQAYEELLARKGPNGNEFVDLADIRDKLSGLSKADFDKAIMALYRSREWGAIPEDNQKVLTARDRAAAVEIGGQNKHYLYSLAAERRRNG